MLNINEFVRGWNKVAEIVREGKGKKVFMDKALDIIGNFATDIILPFAVGAVAAVSFYKRFGRVDLIQDPSDYDLDNEESNKYIVKALLNCDVGEGNDYYLTDWNEKKLKGVWEEGEGNRGHAERLTLGSNNDKRREASIKKSWILFRKEKKISKGHHSIVFEFNDGEETHTLLGR